MGDGNKKLNLYMPVSLIEEVRSVVEELNLHSTDPFGRKVTRSDFIRAALAEHCKVHRALLAGGE